MCLLGLSVYLEFNSLERRHAEQTITDARSHLHTCNMSSCRYTNYAQRNVLALYVPDPLNMQQIDVTFVI